MWYLLKIADNENWVKSMVILTNFDTYFHPDGDGIHGKYSNLSTYYPYRVVMGTVTPDPRMEWLMPATTTV